MNLFMPHALPMANGGLPLRDFFRCMFNNLTFSFDELSTIPPKDALVALVPMIPTRLLGRYNRQPPQRT